MIGSGATAVTLVPAMAQRAAHVTMLQRSPSTSSRCPEKDRLSRSCRKRLGASGGYAPTRRKNIALQHLLLQVRQRRPETVQPLLRQAAIAQLPEGYDVDAHFTPRYNPWDERLCLAPDGDLFRAIRGGQAEVVTDRI